MGALAVPLMVGGTFLSAYGQIKAGKSEKARGLAQKKINEASAKKVVAVSQRQAGEEKRQAELIASRALAVAAAGGGGASDPTVMNIISDIKGEGAYRASLAMYEGEEAASKLRMEGELAEWSGKEAEKASKFSSLSTLVSGGGLAAKYG